MQIYVCAEASIHTKHTNEYMHIHTYKPLRYPLPKKYITHSHIQALYTIRQTCGGINRTVQTYVCTVHTCWVYIYMHISALYLSTLFW